MENLFQKINPDNNAKEMGCKVIDEILQKIINLNAKEKLERIVNDYDIYFQNYLNNLNIKEETKKKINEENKNIIKKIKENNFFIKKRKIANDLLLLNQDIIYNAVEDCVLNSLDNKYPIQQDYHKKMIDFKIDQYFLSYFEVVKNAIVPEIEKEINFTISTIFDLYKGKKIVELENKVYQLLESSNREIINYAMNQNNNNKIMKQKKNKIMNYLKSDNSPDLDPELKMWEPLKDHLNQIMETTIIKEEKEVPPLYYT